MEEISQGVRISVGELCVGGEVTQNKGEPSEGKITIGKRNPLGKTSPSGGVEGNDLVVIHSWLGVLC